MRMIYFDIDALRWDHLGCYGYGRNTSPQIDSLAADGLRFTNYYCADAPCLPSRAGLVTGQFGIHNGIVGHGGTAADLRLLGAKRFMFDQRLMNDLFWQFRKKGMRTVSVSSFPERHSAYWFTAGLNEMINVGGFGDERADEVYRAAADWLGRNAESDNWFLHVHFWDTHTPYRTPESFGNPLTGDPLPEWITPVIFQEHLQHVGPHSLHELNGFRSEAPDNWKQYKRYPGSIHSMEELGNLFDLYDLGIAYVDYHIGLLLDLLRDKGVLDDTYIIVTSDHGEQMGELGVYSEHGCADEATCHVPMIIWGPGVPKGQDEALRYQIDLLPTVAEQLGLPADPRWDGHSYADVLGPGDGKRCKESATSGTEIDGSDKGDENSKDDEIIVDRGYPYLVLTQCAHVCQRAVRFSHYYYIRTYHDGIHEFPTEMLFDLAQDPHEQRNLAQARPDLCQEACHDLVEWEQEQMTKSESQIDPLWTVMKEGGPLHATVNGKEYQERLRKTGREEGAKRLPQRHPELF